MSCQHEHEHGHNHDDDDHIAPPNSNPAQNLWDYIDHDHVRCLNESEQGQAKAVLRRHSDRLSTDPLLESDVDPELLLVIPFTGLVQLHSIHIRSTPDERAPREILLFKNRDDLDFETAADIHPLQTLNHPEGLGVGSSQNNGIVEYAVNRAKFSGLTSLVMYIPSNWGDDEVTALAYIGLSGSWKKMSKAPVVAMYEASANPADHKVKDELRAGQGIQGVEHLGHK